MNKISKKLKKLCSVVLLLSVFLTGSLFIPSYAHAQTTDTITRAAVSSAGGCIAALLSGQLARLFSNFLGGLFGEAAITGQLLEVPVKDNLLRRTIVPKEVGGLTTPSLDGIMFCIANIVIEGILIATTEWVKNGFDGNPAFIDDPGQFFKDIADAELGNLIDELTDGILCSPFNASIEIGLRSTFRGQQNFCTLSEVIENFERFGEDFNEGGGWTGWIELTERPSNNLYGSYLGAYDDYVRRTSSKLFTARLELDWGRGFLSVKKDGKSVTPGVLLQTTVSERLNIPTNRLTFADEFDELMTELVNAVVKIALDELLDLEL